MIPEFPRRVARLVRTVRHLSRRQIAGQIRNRFPKALPHSRRLPDRCAHPGPWVATIPKHRSYLDSGCFRFLNDSSTVPEHGPWWLEDRELLWNYNLHYCDWLNQAQFPGGNEGAADLLLAWHRNNPPGNSRSWDPFPVSLRTINMVRFGLEQGLPDEIRPSLAFHARLLARRLEIHLLANHYLLNGMALMHAGCYFLGREADVWLSTGVKILSRQLDEQILEDGGHFERSPMYHALILEELLNLVNLARCYTDRIPPVVISTIQEKIPLMLSWSTSLLHPDGSIALFNDSAENIAAKHSDLTEYASRLGFDPTFDSVVGSRTSRLLESSGFARLERGAAVVLAEFGGPGPPYQPGHSHAGTNSFEMSLQKVKVVVDTGVSTYSRCDTRLRERSTQAHNTLNVAGSDSSEVWASFRVGARAKGTLVAFDNHTDDLCRLEASHDGYVRKRLGSEHVRSWQLTPGACEIIDSLTAESDVPVELRFHFHPDITLRPAGTDKSWEITHRVKGSLGRIEGDSRVRYSIIPYQYCPEFGVQIDGTALVGVRDPGCRETRHAITW